MKQNKAGYSLNVSQAKITKVKNLDKEIQQKNRASQNRQNKERNIFTESINIFV